MEKRSWNSNLAVALNMLHLRGLTNVTHRGFGPLVLLNRDSAALLVRSDSPYSSGKGP